MQYELYDICKSADSLARGLSFNAVTHKRYKTYMPMERALGIILSGNIYFSNGANWNDIPDRKQMANRNVYGQCFSWSTIENIAMWMLYGGQGGESGAMIDFPAKVIKEMLASASVELGQFNEKGKFEVQYSLARETDYEQYMTDIVYVEHLKNGSVRLTWGDQHLTVKNEVLSDAGIFQKHYAWAYERESRMIFRLTESFLDSHDIKEGSSIRLRLSERAKRLLVDQLYRSPVYKGKTDVGLNSSLFNEVDWKQ